MPAAPAPSAPALATMTALVQEPTAPVRDRALSRFTARDYTYVRRELIRIVIIAVAMMIVILVLSFFLP